MKEHLTKAKYQEWLGSLFGACMIAFALGVWLSESLAWLALPAFVIGVGLHSWGMLKTYNRNR